MKLPRLSVTDGTFSPELWSLFIQWFGEQRANELVKALSHPVRDYGIRVTITKFSRETLIEKFEQNLWKVFPHPKLNEMICVKTKGPFKIPYLPYTPKIIIDKVAAESVFVGSDLFGVGIKRIPKYEINDVVSLASQEDQIVATGIAQIDSRTPKQPGIAVKTTNSFYNVPSLRDYNMLESGEAYSQSIPAAYVAHVLDPKKGETIVDLCAAPGGKSTNAAILSNNEAKIISFDRSKKRLRKMKEAILAQKLSNIQIINADSVDYLKSHTLKADKVIVDPSCTAIGVRPKISDATTYTDIINSANYQKSFLWAAAGIVKEGGIITYSTCTLSPEENEKVIAYAINELKLKLVEPDILLGTSGLDTGDGLTVEYMRRFYPDIHDTPGFFVAKLMK